MNREQAIVAHRPVVATKDISVSPAEDFQNKVLRPVLKFQNPILLDLFRHYLLQRKGVFHQSQRKEKLTYIQDALKKDQRLRERMIGAVLGVLTVQELAAFTASESEFKRRIITLLIQRLQDQLDQL